MPSFAPLCYVAICCGAQVIPEMKKMDKQNQFVCKRDLLNTLPPGKSCVLCRSRGSCSSYYYYCCCCCDACCGAVLFLVSLIIIIGITMSVMMDLVGMGGNISNPKAVQLTLSPAQYLTKVDAATNTYEISIYFDDAGGVILGANAMSGYNTIFDNAKGRVGFVQAKCR